MDGIGTHNSLAIDQINNQRVMRVSIENFASIDRRYLDARATVSDWPRVLLPGQPCRHQRRRAHQAGDIRGAYRSPAPHRPAAPRARRPAPQSARPANFARNSASVRKLAGSPFGTTTFWLKLWPRARDGQLAGHVGGELGLDLRVELADHLRQQARAPSRRAAARSCPSPSRRSPAPPRSRTAR